MKLKNFSNISYYFLRSIEIICRKFAHFFPIVFWDKLFLLSKHKRLFGYKLNLNTPITFNEKLNWLKLYDRKPIYAILTDKYAVRDYVKDKVGEKYLTKLYGVYSNVNEIDFDKLPQKFALKATHGCGWNIICHDKNKLDIIEVKQKFTKWMKLNFYDLKGEWQYKNIPPRIICEEFLEDQFQQVCFDYKFYCFNGIPKFILVVVDRFTNHTEAFFDENWILQPFFVDFPLTTKKIPKPKNLDIMIEIAKKISSGMDFCRVDLYNNNGRIIFGEITLHSNAGFEIFNPPDINKKFGGLLKLTTNK